VPHIFDRFYRSDRARGRGGVGLGLALVRSIVTLHGGTITVESTSGAGSCFRIVLPLATQA
jgi:two-component system sensor histidine kinase BaeS